MVSLAAPRAPAAPSSATLYESHYLTATDRGGGRALWLRHTALKRRHAPAHTTVWLTFFDPSLSSPRALRVTAPEPVGDPGECWSRSSLGELAPGRARGEIGGASWELTWRGQAPEVPYLPARWLYDRVVPRSNGVALVPAGTAAGTVTLDATTLRLDGWDVVVGHNWGSEHADQWVWIHAGGLGKDGAGWLDLALARIRLGPLLTPWLAGGALQLDDRTYAPARGRSVHHELDGERTAVSLPLTGGAELQLDITAPERATVSWDYASPDGAGRDVRNCSVADARITLRTRGDTRSFALRGRVAVEHGRPAR